VSSKVKLAEFEKVKGCMWKQYQVKVEKVDKLEVEVVSLRKQQKMENSTIALDNFLEIQRSPLDKFGLGFQKGECSLHESKNIKE